MKRYRFPDNAFGYNVLRINNFSICIEKDEDAGFIFTIDYPRFSGRALSNSKILQCYHNHEYQFKIELDSLSIMDVPSLVKANYIKYYKFPDNAFGYSYIEDMFDYHVAVLHEKFIFSIGKINKLLEIFDNYKCIHKQYFS